MPIPTITALPVPPSRSDATNFASRGDAFLGALPTFQTEMNAAAAAINAVYFPPIFRNRIINGDFSVWQRATSQTTTGYGSVDRWEMVNTGTARTHSRQAFTLGQTAVPGEPAFFSRHVVVSAAGSSNLALMRQAIEGVRSCAGRNVRLSFWAKADAARPLAVEFVQSFGTAGSPSPLVTGIGAQKFNLTTSWQKFVATVAIPSIAGKTVGNNGDDWLGLNFWFDAGSVFDSRTATLGQQSGTFDISLVQIEEGATDTAFEFRPPGVELALCQRYYEKSNQISEAVPSGAGDTGAAWFMTSATSIVFATVEFKVVKRTPNPSVTYYDLAGTANRVSTSADDGFSIASGGIGARQGRLQIDAAWAGVGASTKVKFHWAVSAEL